MNGSVVGLQYMYSFLAHILLTSPTINNLLVIDINSKLKIEKGCKADTVYVYRVEVFSNDGPI